MSQSQAILNYLETGAELTPLEASNRFGTLRLSARIWDLKREGYEIEAINKQVGHKKHVASYRLKQKQEQLALIK